jgi:hypothetical protein
LGSTGRSATTVSTLLVPRIDAHDLAPAAGFDDSPQYVIPGQRSLAIAGDSLWVLADGDAGGDAGIGPRVVRIPLDELRSL